MRVQTGLALLLSCGLPVAQAANITVLNLDGAGEGLNDPAPFTPVGGNSATTLGQARLNVLNEAARVWGLQLGSPVTIVVEAKFDDLECSTTSGTLGSAGPKTFFTGFNGAVPGVLYAAALADAITGQDLNGRNDINAQFNGLIGGNPSCLGGRSFYLGLDHRPPSNQYFDLLNVSLHEYAHGLGFVSLVDESGASLDTSGLRLAIYDQQVYSETLGRFWPQLTATERAASATSNGALVWNGAAVNGQLASMTAGLSVPGGHLRLYAPSTFNDGSSVSHWDTAAFPNLLMEPFLTANPNGLTDLTGCVFRDMGWPGTRCPDTGTTDTVPAAFPRTVGTNEDTSVQFTLLGNDPDGPAALTYTIVSQPGKGVLTPLGTLTSSTGVAFQFTPNADVNGSDTFTFRVSDSSSSSAPATVTINIAAVNDAPVAGAGSASTVPGAAVAVNLSASDIDSSTLAYSIVTNPAHGTLTGAAPTLTYTPAAGFSGSDSFAFRASDGLLDSNIATFTINVTTPAPTGGGGGGGGGSFDPRVLAMLLLFAALQGRRRVATVRLPAAACGSSAFPRR